MDMEKLLKSSDEKLVHILPEEELNDLLEKCEVVTERDTLISGLIRILKFGPYFLTQELTPKKEIVLRRYNSREEAEQLVFDHMETYDQMWDGCGCKVNYYS